MNKHAAPTARPTVRYHYKSARRGKKLVSLGIVFVFSVIISFLVAHVTYRLYRGLIDEKTKVEQRTQEQQSMEALLEQY